MRTSGIPRTTYRNAKHRMYSEGLLEGLLIPNPGAIGVPCISFLVSRPSAEKANSAVETLSRIPGTVEAWLGTQIVFAVVFHNTAGAREAFQRMAADGKVGEPRVIVSVNANQPRGSVSQVPVYFDFEGAWSRFCGLSASKRYPCPLPPPPQPITRRERPQRENPSTMVSLFTRDLSRPSHLTSLSSVPRSQLRNLRSGMVEWRVYLDISRLHLFEYRGLAIQDIVFVIGKLKDSSSMAELIPDLVSGRSLRPILLVSDGTSVLLASLDIGLVTVKNASLGGRQRQSVIEKMARHLEDIEVIREPLALLKMRVAHRYDVLVRAADHD